MTWRALTVRPHAAEPDFTSWRHRLQIHAVDLRDISALEAFCDFLKATLPRLDVVVNNACQTVRRPSSYYAHLLGAERALEAAVAVTAVPAAAAAMTMTAEAAGTGAGAAVTAAAGMAAGTCKDDSIAGLIPLVAQQAARAQGRAEGVRAAWLGEGGHGFDGDDGVAAAALAPSPAQLSQLNLTSDDHTHTVTAGRACQIWLSTSPMHSEPSALA